MASTKPTKQNDELLKGAFEEWFIEFLRFIYPNANDLFDFARGLTFMDKELLAIIPERERKKGKRVADLLVKVYLKDGAERWILLHTEIEGGSQEDFAFRIFQYHYRILDRYRVPVETIAVFTGDKNQHKPSEYVHRGIDTSIHFRYRAYHIFDNDEAELLQMDNAFALIVVACQKALLEGKVPDKELSEDRLTIARALLRHDYDHDRIISFLVFLKNFLYIKDSEINRIFDEHVIQLTGGAINMGIIETVKKQERQKGRREEAIAIARELKKEGLSVEFIAKTTKLTIKEVEKL
ncbi:RpnC/YadD family protein [Parapedobacter koreensis]|uniref:Transposase (putative) YhgA-like domain-containing protein n=1 Tax=Parapedobacter koreensis TaxID=332977 RepID=A0A1H7FGN0_9SPHI|nr:hypothetical protein [Parapedobacter koreensis]SEK24417.1 conserved hypothetical protein (putative transposase or invertase) [Parapedobacter koreensis]